MNISIIGAGMGAAGTLTADAQRAVHDAGIVIGAERLFQCIPDICRAKRLAAVTAEDILKIIDQYASEDLCVLMSGDVGFYSGAAKLLEALGDRKIRVIPGISSVQYFAASLRRPWQDWKLASAHGKTIDAAGEVQGNRETFFLTGGELGIQALCGQLAASGFGALRVTVGENLGGDNERIKTDTAGALALSAYEPLAVMLVDNPRPDRRVSCGFADDCFIRGGIPMTKSEVRSVILSKLRLRDSDTVYDVGAGTGSVSVEAALLSVNGSVFAFERTPEGCRLISDNAVKFGAANITVVAGEAPAAFSGLPAPDAAFIGGSGGNLRDILEALLHLNPKVRLVASAVTLETLSEATALFSSLPVHDPEIVQLSVCRAKLMGSHHLLTAHNPVFIVSGAGGDG
jgi:precorrin-6Y C5,15-methyltransferase (decarboxylating)